MNDNPEASQMEDKPHQHAHAAPTTQQMRTVGQRRRDAEVKLEHHLDEARHKNEPHDGQDGDAGPDVDGADVAAIQNDDRLTAADRVDMIANQVVPGREEGGTEQPGRGKP